MFSFFKRVKNTYKPSALIEEIAEGFLYGKLSKCNISKTEISEMAINYLGKRVTISWYADDQSSYRSFDIDGTNSIANDKDIHYILKAAITRAFRIHREEFDKLEKLRQENLYNVV